MTPSRDHLQIGLNRLLVHLPRMQRDYPDPAEFWPVFAAEADVLIDGAGPDNYDWVVCKIDAMLESRGLLARQ